MRNLDPRAALSRGVRALVGVMLVGATLGLAACAKQEPPADAVFVEGVVHTLDPAQPLASAVAIRDGRIVAVGDKAAMGPFIGDATEITDLEGAVVYPGFTDAHMHLEGIGRRELEFNLEGTASLADLKARVAARIAALPKDAAEDAWIVGRGWIETHWPEQRFPTRADLDAAAPGHPVYLTRADGHASVANSKALALGGVTRATTAPAGGAILKDAKGEPTGMLIDDAQALVERHFRGDDIDPVAALETAIAREQRLGWTGVQDAGVSWAVVERMRALCAEGALGLRWYAALDAPSTDAERLIAQGPVQGECDGRITVRALKFYMDGALGSRGAALLAKYADDDSDGLLRNDPKALAEQYAKALSAGLQVWTHAIGDRGNRLVLDLYQRALSSQNSSGKRGTARWRIEHAQVIAPEDLPRFDKLGVIPSMQPSHAIGDLFFAPARLGPERLKGAYAWRTLIDSGAIVPAGSDAPVEQGDPRIEFYAAVARRSLDGRQLEGWHPELAMTREEALLSLTKWPAYAAFEEAERGTIEVGKRADLTVFDRDLLTVPEAEILKAEVVMTVVGGEIVFARD
jgi:predicted amidohydrolase YtcJ